MYKYLVENPKDGEKRTVDPGVKNDLVNHHKWRILERYPAGDPRSHLSPTELAQAILDKGAPAKALQSDAEDGDTSLSAVMDIAKANDAAARQSASQIVEEAKAAATDAVEEAKAAATEIIEGAKTAAAAMVAEMIAAAKAALASPAATTLETPAPPPAEAAAEEAKAEPAGEAQKTQTQTGRTKRQF